MCIWDGNAWVMIVKECHLQTEPARRFMCVSVPVRWVDAQTSAPPLSQNSTPVHIWHTRAARVVPINTVWVQVCVFWHGGGCVECVLGLWTVLGGSLWSGLYFLPHSKTLTWRPPGVFTYSWSFTWEVETIPFRIWLMQQMFLVFMCIHLKFFLIKIFINKRWLRCGIHFVDTKIYNFGFTFWKRKEKFLSSKWKL